MKYSELDPSVRRRASGIKLSPEGDVLELRLRPPRVKLSPEKPAPTPVPHKPDDPMCQCEDCRLTFQAADG